MANLMRLDITKWTPRQVQNYIDSVVVFGHVTEGAYAVERQSGRAFLLLVNNPEEVAIWTNLKRKC